MRGLEQAAAVSIWVVLAGFAGMVSLPLLTASLPLGLICIGVSLTSSIIAWRLYRKAMSE